MSKKMKQEIVVLRPSKDAAVALKEEVHLDTTRLPRRYEEGGNLSHQGDREGLKYADLHDAME
jgi:hypothetical protein